MVGESKKIESYNKTLKKIFSEVFGGKLELILIDPASPRLRPMSKNARYMTKEQFNQLQSNLMNDGILESVPLVHRLSDGDYEIISGHHRIEAAAKAELKSILVMVIPEELDLSEKRSRQISHNAISGQDDMQTLSAMWHEVTKLSDKLYSGLDSETIGVLEKIKFEGLNAYAIRTEFISFWFLPEEVTDFEELLAHYTAIAGSKKVYLAPLEKYDTLMRGLIQAKKLSNVRNTAVAFGLLVDDLKTIIDNMEQDAATEETEQAGVA